MGTFGKFPAQSAFHHFLQTFSNSIGLYFTEYILHKSHLLESLCFRKRDSAGPQIEKTQLIQTAYGGSVGTFYIICIDLQLRFCRDFCFFGK
jgi:hypothetical protein